ncbi:hypothetical protein [Brevibacterium aurantiacum]|uniref:Uncharacterized protein n=1 Tax=Brevibacterium aurantiacum TaxID=273384 RepID=A0A2H1I4M2_BREAU|nr:hypothetical protein [Brevibacterium aurantiacum]GEB23000.1 hypothetical protein BAU01nite_17330 [Brevibacterium aurantiacum]SMX70125.1 hypothetical protein BAUR9175_00938 [Brevibacterium aurantiacum]
MSEDVSQPVDDAAATSFEDVATTSFEDRTQVHAHDGEPVSDDMASAAAVAAVVAIRQVALAYAANQAAALDQMETAKHDRAGFNAPRRNVRRRLPQAWTQTLGR